MKTLLILVSLSLSSAVFACSPPPLLMSQKLALDQAMNSKELSKALQDHMNRDFNVSLKSMQVNGAVVMKLSDGCTITAVSRYKPAISNGMCPRFDKVIVTEVCL